MGTWYDGWYYFQQGRKCGRVSCSCAAGQLHGPYWYRRSATTGKAKYVGKELRPELRAAIELRDGLAPALAAHVAQLQADIELLEKVISGSGQLQLDDKHRLEQLDYAMLIPPTS